AIKPEAQKRHRNTEKTDTAEIYLQNQDAVLQLSADLLPAVHHCATLQRPWSPTAPC
ncbi:hypothetical protein CHARACLAT_031320, partial [Characodon lateralis]|nr:hypothetical protein [Characodon lateralis]